MAPKIFITGATGYIGGDALYALHQAHPEYEYTLLVRNEQRGKAIQEQYPRIRLAFGDLDSADVIQKAAAEADVVLHTADSSDNVPSANAIAKGIAAGHSAENPGYWIHLCGTGILMWYDEANKRSGQPPAKGQKYHDIIDINRIVNLPDEAFHRNVDKIVLAAAENPAVKVAIVGPPTIYGPGRGPGNRRSRQAYDMAKFTLKKGYAPIVETGLTTWDNVHVHDLSELWVLLVEAALDPSKNANPEVFGPRAYYFLENGSHLWSDVATWIATEAHKQGYLPEARTQQTTMKDISADSVGISDPSWALNSQSVAARASQYLGWTPAGKSLHAEIPDIVHGEAEELGLKPRD